MPRVTGSKLSNSHVTKPADEDDEGMNGDSDARAITTQVTITRQDSKGLSQWVFRRFSLRNNTHGPGNAQCSGGEDIIRRRARVDARE